MNPLRTGASAVFPYTKALEQKYTKMSRFEDRFEMFKVVGKEIHLPRELFPVGAIDERVEGYPIHVKSKFIPRNDDQLRIVKESEALLRNDTSHIIEAATGFGKTVIGAELIARIGVKALVIINKEDLIKQWFDALQIIGFDKSDVGLIQADSCAVAGRKVCIGMIHSLAKAGRYPDWIYNEFGLVIFDESASPDTLVTTDKGQIRIQDIVKNEINCKALSYNLELEVYEWKHILAYHEHPPKNPMMRIHHEKGYLDFTSEHLVLTKRGWVKAQNLTSGDVLYIDLCTSQHYNNSKLKGDYYGSMVIRDNIRGWECTPIQEQEVCEIKDKPWAQTGQISVGEVLETKSNGWNTPKEKSEWGLGGLLCNLYDSARELAPTLLPCNLHRRWEAYSCSYFTRTSLERVVGMVAYGRWRVEQRVPYFGFKQVSKTRLRSITKIPKDSGRWGGYTKSQRALLNLQQRIKQVLKEGVKRVLCAMYDVQIGRGAFRRKSENVQSVQRENEHTRWVQEGEGVLYQRSMSESKKDDVLPTKQEGIFGGRQREGHSLGGETRILWVERIATPTLVYDIEVEDNHNFVANGIVVHNCHIVGAETFSETCWKFPSKLRLGLSATPYRKDGKDGVFKGHIGKVMVKGVVETLIPKVIIQRTGFKLPLVPRKVQGSDGQWKTRMVQFPHSPGRTQGLNKLLAKDNSRNNIIASFVKAAYDKGRNTVIMSELKEGHLEVLKSKFVQSGIPTKDIDFYVGGMKEAAREKAKRARVVLATYQMCSMATDAPWWDTLVLATPRSDVNQIVGRVRREYEGKISALDEGKVEGKPPVVLDLVDDDSPLLAGYCEARKKWYRSIKAVLRIGGSNE